MKKCFLIFVCIFLLCGCSGSKPEYLISGIGVDKSDDGYLLCFEAVIVNTENTEQTLKVLKGEGKTLSQAFDEIKQQSTQPLLMAHNGVIAVDKDADKNELKEICEYVKDVGITLSTYVIKTADIQKLFKTKPLSSICIGYDIMSLMKQNPPYKNRLFELASRDYNTTLPVISIKDGGLIFEEK